MREIPDYFSPAEKARAAAALAKNPRSHLVPLEEWEQDLALNRGMLRRNEALKNGRREARGLIVQGEDHAQRLNIVGSIGEIAFPKWLGAYPFNPPKDGAADFFGCIETKTRQNHEWDLLIPVIGPRQRWYALLSCEWSKGAAGETIFDPFAIVHGAFRGDSDLSGTEVRDLAWRNAPVHLVTHDLLIPADEARMALRMVACQALQLAVHQAQLPGSEVPAWAV